MGHITADIVVSGNIFAIVPVEQFNLKIEMGNASKLTKLGLLLREELSKAVKIQVPGRASHLNIINQVDFSEKLNEEIPPSYKNVLIFGNGSLDRSPCGTGTAAKMALLYANGLLLKDQKFSNQGITGTTFSGMIKEIYQEDGYTKLVSSVSSPAYITGFNQLVVTGNDPFYKGFLLE